MFKNLKLLFFTLLFSLFLFPSFFLFLPSSSPSSSSFLASDSRSYPSIDKWTSNERKKTLSSLLNNSPIWISAVAFGLKKLKFKSNGQDVVFHFDKLAAAFQPEILKQKKIPVNPTFVFTNIQGEAQKQLLQVYNPGKITFVDNFAKVVLPKLNEYGNIFLDSIRSSLLKMKTLGLFKVDVSHRPEHSVNSITSLKNLESVLYENVPSAPTYLMKDFALYSFSPIPNNAKNVLDKAINTTATPWLRALQEVNDFNLTHLTVEKEQIDVSSLVNSKVQEASELSLEQIKILKKLQPLALEKLKIQVQNWINPQLTFYKTNIQPILTNFANIKIKKIKINDILYQVDLLLKESNLKSTGANLPQLAKTQLSALAKAKITPQVLENALQDAKLEIYRLTIVNNLNALRDNNISQVQINDKTYSLIELIKLINKNKVVTLLSIPAKTELAVLAKNAITKTQLDTALNTILTTREAAAKKPKPKTPQTQKKSDQKKLIIGLSVGGGVLTLSSLGGFLYWFFKIKK